MDEPAVAVSLRETRGRVPFGRVDAPHASVADAVAASCAIPGFFRPVRIGSRRYVDGGIYSASNLDLLAGRGLDLVICLNPLSSLEPEAGGGPSGALGRAARRANGRRLGFEAKRVRAYGTEVALIQPLAEDHVAMGRNLMSAARRQQVIETAERTVAAQLREPAMRELLRGLPRGEPHMVRKPRGPVEGWPRIGARRAA